MRREALSINMEDKTAEYRLGALENEVRDLKTDIKSLLQVTSTLQISVATLTTNLTAITSQLTAIVTPGSGLVCEEHKRRLGEFQASLSIETQKREEMSKRFERTYGIAIAIMCLVNLLTPVLLAKLMK